MKTKYTNKNKGKKDKKGYKNRTMKMGRKMKGGAGANDQICHQIGELRDKNIFNIFRSAVQLPKITLM
jgi:hypothetical protein